MKYITTIICLLLRLSAQVQDDLMNLLDQQAEDPVHFTEATFKGSRLINGHTIETREGGELEFLISHRFGRLNSGAYEFFGLDAANIRLGLELGGRIKLTGSPKLVMIGCNE